MQSRADDGEEDIAHFSSPEKPLRHGLKYSARSGRGSNGVLQSHGREARVAEPPISTGLSQLDAALVVPSPVSQSPFRPTAILKPRLSDVEVSKSPSPGGLRRGEVTEITGPRGIGKTLLAMEAAASVLKAGEDVVWIDTAGPMCTQRFRDVLSKIDGSSDIDRKGSEMLTVDEMMKKMHHFHVSTLSHMIALLSLSPAGFPPPRTGLIVVDSMSSLLRAEFRVKLRKAFSKPANDGDIDPGESIKNSPKSTGLDPQEERLRWRVIGDILNSLKKSASIYTCAVIVTNEMATRFRSGQKPMLHETLTGPTWDIGMGTKIVLYWVWLPEETRSKIASKAQAVRVAEVLRAGKVSGFRSREDRTIPYIVQKTGIGPVMANWKPAMAVSEVDFPRSFNLAGSKRKLNDEDTSIDVRTSTQSSTIMTSQDLIPDIATPVPMKNLDPTGFKIDSTRTPEIPPLEEITALPPNQDMNYQASGGIISTSDKDIFDRSTNGQQGAIEMAGDDLNTTEQEDIREPVVYDSYDEEDT